MSNPFDQFFSAGSKPLRRDGLFRIKIDGAGKPVVEVVEGETITLSPEGSIDRAKVLPDRFYHCGHNAQAPMGGRCAEAGCQNISCERCFTCCRCCQKPVCLEHVRRVPTDNAQIDLCGRCYDELMRKRRLKTFARAVLSPFVNFEKKSSP